MELNEKTIDLLKNFSGVNPNIMIRAGNTLKTMSEARNVLATAEVDESFPQEFGIYDLNEFISVLGLVDTPSLKFNDEYVTISDSSGRSQVKYFFSAEETLTTPSKDITMPATELSFEMTNDTLNKLKRAASTLGHDEVSISSKDNIVNMSVVDSKNSTSNTYSIDIDAEFPEGATFNFIMSIANLKILPGDYKVDVSSKLITQWSHKELNVKYWIALEKSSTYGV